MSYYQISAICILLRQMPDQVHCPKANHKSRRETILNAAAMPLKLILSPDLLSYWFHDHIFQVVPRLD